MQPTVSGHPATPPSQASPADAVAAGGGLSAEVEVTQVVAPPRWALTTEFNDVAWLDTNDVVIGRAPVATTDATPMTLNDPGMTLSKTHARLRRDPRSDTWTIEDLGSTNGVQLFDETLTSRVTLTPGQPATATSFIVLGDMRVRLQRHHQGDMHHKR